MAEVSKDTSWDSVDERMGFREQIGSQRFEDTNQAADDAAMDSAQEGADKAAAISMPEESLPADDPRSFREQLSTQDDGSMDDAAMSGDMAADDALTAAAKEQLEDDAE